MCTSGGFSTLADESDEVKKNRCNTSPRAAEGTRNIVDDNLGTCVLIFSILLSWASSNVTLFVSVLNKRPTLGLSVQI